MDEAQEAAPKVDGSVMVGYIDGVADDEQRAHERFTLLFPIRIENPSGEIEAICREVSAGGVLITGSAGTPATELEVGEAVMVSLPPAFASGSGGPLFGRVVRVGESSEPGALREIAIEFIQPVPELAAMFKKTAVP